MSKEFKDYISSTGNIIWIVLAALTLFASIKMFISSSDGDSSAAMPAMVFLILGVVLMIAPVKSYLDLKKLQDDVNIRLIDEDFHRAQPYRDDLVRFGDRWIFTKRSNRVVGYNEIVQIYQYVHSTNGVEDHRMIQYKDVRGKTGTLCKLKLRGASDGEMKNIVAFIYSKNPNIKIGYR